MLIGFGEGLGGQCDRFFHVTGGFVKLTPVYVLPVRGGDTLLALFITLYQYLTGRIFDKTKANVQPPFFAN